MKKYLILLLPLLLCSCSYVSRTKVIVKADKVKAIAKGDVQEGKVLLDRSMCVGFCCKK